MKTCTVRELPNEVESFSKLVDVEGIFGLLDIGYTYEDYPIIFVLSRGEEIMKVWGIPKEKSYTETCCGDETPVWYTDCEAEELYARQN